MTALDANDLFDATVARAVGRPESGSRGERPALETWKAYPHLTAGQRLVVQQVWNGTRPDALVVQGMHWHFLRHHPGGLPDPAGRRYGFVVRTLNVPPPPPPPRTNWLASILVVFGVLLLVTGALAAGVFAPLWAPADWLPHTVRSPEPQPIPPAVVTQPSAPAPPPKVATPPTADLTDLARKLDAARRKKGELKAQQDKLSQQIAASEKEEAELVAELLAAVLTEKPQ